MERWHPQEMPMQERTLGMHSREATHTSPRGLPESVHREGSERSLAVSGSGLPSPGLSEDWGRRPVPPWPIPPPAALLLPGHGLRMESLANWPGLHVGTHLEQMFPRLHSAPGSLDKSAGVGAAGAGGRGLRVLCEGVVKPCSCPPLIGCC